MDVCVYVYACGTGVSHRCYADSVCAQSSNLRPSTDKSEARVGVSGRRSEGVRGCERVCVHMCVYMSVHVCLYVCVCARARVCVYQRSVCRHVQTSLDRSEQVTVMMCRWNMTSLINKK